MFLGPNCCFNESRLPYYLKFEPHPSSTKNLEHYFQSKIYHPMPYAWKRDIPHSMHIVILSVQITLVKVRSFILLTFYFRIKGHYLRAFSFMCNVYQGYIYVLIFCLSRIYICIDIFRCNFLLSSTGVLMWYASYVYTTFVFHICSDKEGNIQQV